MVPETSASPGRHQQSNISGMLSEISEGKQLEALSLYLSKSGISLHPMKEAGWKIILGICVLLAVAARNCHGNDDIYCLKHLIFTQDFASAQTFPYARDLWFFQGPRSLPWARDHHFCVTLIVSRASSLMRGWDCVHITQVQSLLFLAESTFLQINPSLCLVSDSCLMQMSKGYAQNSEMERNEEKHLLARE